MINVYLLIQQTLILSDDLEWRENIVLNNKGIAMKTRSETRCHTVNSVHNILKFKAKTIRRKINKRHKFGKEESSL